MREYSNLYNWFYQLYFSMMFEWTKHRFSGGLLALDVANTVVCRHDVDKRIDRFTNDETVEAFVKAAVAQRPYELAGYSVAETIDAKQREALVDLRESIDSFVRVRLHSDPGSANALARLFEAAASASCSTISPSLSFGAHVAVSAMKLLDAKVMRRCKICPNCGWLFLDRSKNQSRLWCDMAVCGNRAKAKAHYRRTSITRKQQTGLSQ